MQCCRYCKKASGADALNAHLQACAQCAAVQDKESACLCKLKSEPDQHYLFSGSWTYVIAYSTLTGWSMRCSASNLCTLWQYTGGKASSPSALATAGTSHHSTNFWIRLPAQKMFQTCQGSLVSLRSHARLARV